MKARSYLELHLDSARASRIIGYLQDAQCNLVITRPRKTKRGDFRAVNEKNTITVNRDENSFRFLFTLVHEIAHLKTHLDYGRSIKPHGKEWKTNFKFLFHFFGMDEVFQSAPYVYAAVLEELERPKACSGVNLHLEAAFAENENTEGMYLFELAPGQQFEFRSNRYRKVQDRRTRVLCINLSNNKQYTINKAAKVVLCE